MAAPVLVQLLLVVIAVTLSCDSAYGYPSRQHGSDAGLRQRRSPEGPMDVFKEGYEKAKEKFDSVSSAAKEKFDSASAAAKEKFDSASAAAKEKFDSASSMAKGAFAAAKEKLNEMRSGGSAGPDGDVSSTSPETPKGVSRFV